MEVTKQGWGQKITLKVGEDLTGASQLKLLLKPPNDDEIVVTGTCDDYAVGDVYWVTTAGFWAVAGAWKTLARIRFDSDELLHTRPYAITVVDQFA
jgi:hypothetical protein